MIELPLTPPKPGLDPACCAVGSTRAPRLATSLAVCGVALLLWLVYAPGGGDAWLRPLALLAGLLASSLCFRVTRHGSIDRRLRSSWQLIGAAVAVSVVGDAMSLGLGDGERGHGTDSLAAAGRLLFYPIAVAGLLRLPTLIRHRAETAALGLDVATTTVGAGIVIGWLGLGPSIAGGLPDASQARVAVSLLANTVVLTGVARLLLRPLPGSVGRSFDLLAVGLLLQLVGSVIEVGRSSLGGHAIREVASAFGVATYALVGLAARAAETRSDLRIDATDASPYRTSLLPYVCAGAGYALVLGVALSGSTQGLGTLVLATVVLSGLVLARQALAVRHVVAEERAAGERKSELGFRSVVQSSSDSVLVIASDGTIRYASTSTAAVLGRAPENVVGRRVEEVAHADDRGMLAQFITDSLACPASNRSLTWRVTRDDGGTTLLETVATNLADDPQVRGLVVNSRDVTERKSLEDQLMHQAFHDALTGLPNRALFSDRVEHALSRAMRGGHTVSVLFLDLDNFKTINDSLGHAAGDRVLLAAAERIRRSQRAMDTAARLGGDEFAILLDGVSGPAAPGVVAERIMTAFREVFSVENQSVVVTASVGVAVAQPGDTAEMLLRNADAAMYVAKGRGRGRWAMFEPAMHASAVEELEMRRDMHEALAKAEFRVVYQPIVSLRDGRVEGAEALLRWDHPRRGTLSPGAFLTLAEQTGAIIPIGAWVLKRAAIDLERWRRARLGPDGPYVSVNVSFRQLQGPGVEELVRSVLAGTDIPPASLILEITESGLVEDKERVIPALTRLRALGVRVAIDDFGTGYSSLEYLQQLPMDLLKIPKIFVDELRNEQALGTVPHAILSMAHALELGVVAEGVEDAVQARRLLAMGCTRAQGYHFARPMDLDALLALTAREDEVASASMAPGLSAPDA